MLLTIIVDGNNVNSFCHNWEVKPMQEKGKLYRDYKRRVVSWILRFVNSDLNHALNGC